MFSWVQKSTRDLFLIGLGALLLSVVSLASDLRPDFSARAPRESLHEAPISNQNLGPKLTSATVQSTGRGYDIMETEDGALVGLQFESKVNATRKIFRLEFPARARQDMLVWLYPKIKSRLVPADAQSLWMLFPRAVVPAIRQDPMGSKLTVTLPSREELKIDRLSAKITEGAFKENENELDYAGGEIAVYLRAHGQDPRIASTAFITKGKGAERRECKVAASELFESADEHHFKFPTDLEFHQYLTRRCGFGFNTLPTEDILRVPSETGAIVLKAPMEPISLTVPRSIADRMLAQPDRPVGGDGM